MLCSGLPVFFHDGFFQVSKRTMLSSCSTACLVIVFQIEEFPCPDHRSIPEQTIRNLDVTCLLESEAIVRLQAFQRTEIGGIQHSPDPNHFCGRQDVVELIVAQVAATSENSGSRR